MEGALMESSRMRDWCDVIIGTRSVDGVWVDGMQQGSATFDGAASAKASDPGNGSSVCRAVVGALDGQIDCDGSEAPRGTHAWCACDGLPFFPISHAVVDDGDDGGGFSHRSFLLGQKAAGVIFWGTDRDEPSTRRDVAKNSEGAAPILLFCASAYNLSFGV